MTSTSRSTLLEKRWTVIAALLFFSFEALWSWVEVTKLLNHEARVGHDVTYVVGLGVAIFITVSITYRSSFVGDRIVFGAASGAFLLLLVNAVAPVAPFAMVVIKSLASLMWTIAAGASAFLLIRYFRKSSANS